MNKSELATELRTIAEEADEIVAALNSQTYTASSRLSTRLTACLPLVRWHLGDGFVDELVRAGERAKGLEREQIMLPYDPDLDDSAKALVLKVGWESFARTEGVDLCAIASVLEQADSAVDGQPVGGEPAIRTGKWFEEATTINDAAGVKADALAKQVERETKRGNKIYRELIRRKAHYRVDQVAKLNPAYADFIYRALESEAN